MKNLTFQEYFYLSESLEFKNGGFHMKADDSEKGITLAQVFKDVKDNRKEIVSNRYTMKTKDQMLLEQAYKKVLNEISGFDEDDSASDAQQNAPQDLKEIEQDLMSGEFGAAYGKLEKLLKSLEPLVGDMFTKEEPKGPNSEEFLKQRMSLKFDEEDNQNN